MLSPAEKIHDIIRTVCASYGINQAQLMMREHREARKEAARELRKVMMAGEPLAPRYIGKILQADRTTIIDYLGKRDVTNDAHRDHSVKQEILKYLEGKSWIFGGVLCRAIHEITNAKESIVEKRAREMAIDGEILRRYVKQKKDGLDRLIELLGWEETDVNHGVVQYRAKPPLGYEVYRVGAETVAQKPIFSPA